MSKKSKQRQRAAQKSAEPQAQADPELIDIQELGSSMSGFEEIAIMNHFKSDLNSLQHKGTLGLRAFAYLVHRRAGMRDRDAYRAAMEARADSLTDMFDVSGADGEPQEYEHEDLDPKAD